MIVPTLEGNNVMVCVNILDIPDDGLECDVTVPLSAMDGKASESSTNYRYSLFLCGKAVSRYYSHYT